MYVTHLTWQESILKKAEAKVSIRQDRGRIIGHNLLIVLMTMLST